MLAALFFFLSLAAFADLTGDLSSLMQKYKTPGLTGALSLNGKILHSSAVGVRKLGSPERLSTQDKFHLGSCTKAMTATLVAMFVEEGKLGWSQTMGELFSHLDVHPELRNVRIDQLLAHQSRIQKDALEIEHVLAQMDMHAGRRYMTEEMLRKKPQIEAGKDAYSNVGYIIVGHILERLSGKSWEDLIRQKLFLPLDMRTCGFGPTSVRDELPITQPWGHRWDGDTLVPRHADNYDYMAPAAMVHCSIEDWNKFLTLHLNAMNGRAWLLSSASFQKLHSAYPESVRPYTPGGWIRLERGWAKGPVLTHTGSNTMNYANVWIAPKVNAVLMSTTNRGQNEAFLATDGAVGVLLNYLPKN